MKNYIEEVALSGIEGQPLYLTPAKGLKIAKAYLLWLMKKTGKTPDKITITVGQDPRLSGRLLKVACFNALVPYGVNCLDCDLSATPAMEALTIGELAGEPYNLKSDGAIMITSSTGEPHMNGFKFFNKEGILKEEDYTEILTTSEAEEDYVDLGELSGMDNFKIQYGKRIYNTTEIDLLDLYSKYLCDGIKAEFNSEENYELPLLGKKIAVDASNGTGGFIATKVFARLGAVIQDSQYLEPDGNFFNHPPDSKNETAKHSIAMKTLAKSCDLGFLFNSDLSSFSAFDKLGFEIPVLASNIKIDKWLISNLKSLLPD